MCDPKATVDTIPACLVPTTVAKSNFCYWHLADLDVDPENVCFRVQSGRPQIAL